MKNRFKFISVALALAGATPAIAGTTYTIQRIGTVAPSNQLGTDSTFGQSVEQSAIYYANASGIVIGGESTPTSSGSAGTALWYYTGTSSIPIGLTGPQYQRSNHLYITNPVLNTAYSNSRIFNNGYVTGLTNRYDNYSNPYNGTAPNNVGEDAWIFNGNGATANNTVAIPLPSSVIVPTSSSSGATPAVTAANLAYSYATGTPNGTFENFASVQTGGNGSAAGTISLYYSANGSTGWTSKATDAFYYNGSSTYEIGLADNNNVSTTGNTPFTRSSSIVRINKLGVVVGTSSYYGGATTAAATGTDIWVYDPTNASGTGANGTTLISPPAITAGSYTGISTAGALPVYLTDSGIVAAQYQVFGPADTARTTALATDAYLYNTHLTGPAAWTQVGLTGSDYTFYSVTNNKTGIGGSTIPNLSSAYQAALNEAGQATGFTKRTASVSGTPTALGQDAWVYYPTAVAGVGPGSVRVGLIGGAYENTSVGAGLVTRSSVPVIFSATGQVVGTSTRYVTSSSATTAGADAWTVDPAHGTTSAVEIGLNSDTGYGANHEWTNTAAGATNVTRTSNVIATNSGGMVAGVSLRFTSAGGGLGQDAWVYDPTTAKTYSVDPNSPTSNTVFNSTISYISDSGVALGFDTTQNQTPAAGSSDFNYKLFEWSLDFDPGTGLKDIPDFQYLDTITSDVNPNSYTATTWHELFDTVNFAPSMTANGDIVGLGGLDADYLPNHTTTSDAPFVLTPTGVPEPTLLGVLAIAGVGILGRRRRSN